MLKKCPKIYTYDQDKALNPEDTVRIAFLRLARYNKKLIKRFYSNNNYFGIPQYMTESIPELRHKYYPSSTNGKGATESQARASCIMEFVERYSSGKYAGWIKKRYCDMSNDEVLPLESVAVSLDYREEDLREIIDEMKCLPMDWAKGENLFTKRSVYLPGILFETCSTGQAAGNTLEEAVLQGLCECVERHSGAQVQWTDTEYPTIKKDTIDSSVINELLKKIESRNVDVIIKDFSDIMKIPTIGVLLIDMRNKSNIGCSIGVCPDKEKALIRALTESVQSPAGYSDRMLKNRTGSYYYDKYEQAEHLIKGESKSFQRVIDIRDNDINEEICRIVNILGDAGHEAMYVDMTDSVLQIPVVWVYVRNAFLSFRSHPLPFWIGKIYSGLKKDDAACRHFLRVRTVRNNHSMDTLDYFHIAICYQNKKQYSAAIDYFEKSMDSDLRDTERAVGYFQIAVCNISLGKYEVALNTLEKALELDRTNGDVLLQMGNCYRLLRRYEIAVKYYKSAFDPDIKLLEKWEPHFYMGMCLANLGDYTGAERSLRSSIEYDPKKWVVYNFLGRVYAEKKEYDNAIAALEKAIQINPSAALNYNTMGVLMRDKKDYTNAIAMFIKAIELNPMEWSNYTLLGNTYRQIGDYESAVKTYETVSRIVTDPEVARIVKQNLDDLRSRMGKIL
ncbi:MAG: Ribosomal protein S12 methylthiotransferase accessory factor YcaO [Elusimicrobia bacterium ADurb.Bin231]|nr:MAG: Ribosomal protein S12 methylthiotransferase accessory factor YcaO [Elusimicrobia bacterium ADurb.Bin231]